MRTLAADACTGVAVHSLRAVDPEGLAFAAELAPLAPLHIHAAEQTAEVEEVEASLGARPVEWLLANAAVRGGTQAAMRDAGALSSGRLADLVALDSGAEDARGSEPLDCRAVRRPREIERIHRKRVMRRTPIENGTSARAISAAAPRKGAPGR